MRFRSSWLSAVIIAASLGPVSWTAAAPLPAPYKDIARPENTIGAPKTANTPPATDTRNVDILSYDLDIRLDPAHRSITGTVIIGLRALADLSTLKLDLVAELSVNRTSDRLGDLTFDHISDQLNINLRFPLAAGAVDSITIEWSGQPPRHGSFYAGLMFRSHNPGTPGDPADDVPIIANVSQPWSAHSWWPCKDHPSDKALVSVAITVPDTLVAIANGSLLEDSPAGPGWRRFSWRERYPLPTYLVSVAVSNYSSWYSDCLVDNNELVRLEFHTFPEDRAHAEIDLAPTCYMMNFLVNLLGPWPYTDEKYAQVEIKWVGGMEHTTATSLAQMLFTGNGRFDNLFLHEMSHQWFGDSLTPARWADIWLNEGFARYAEALWVEHRQGRDAYLDFMATIGPRRHPDFFRGEGILSDPDPILPNTLIYDKGAWVLHMLRDLIGDTAFFQFLRTYASDPRLAYQTVSATDMIAAAEQAAGRPLSRFFDPWLNTDEAPLISAALGQTASSVSITLRQHQDPVFMLPVPIVLHRACGDSNVTMCMTKRTQTATWLTACRVDSITLAPGQSALISLRSDPPPPLTVTGPAPNPSSILGTEFKLYLTIAGRVEVTVYDVRGRKISADELGWLSVTGPPNELSSQPHLWHWSPNAHGQSHPQSGLYYLEFRSGQYRRVRPVTLLK